MDGDGGFLVGFFKGISTWLAQYLSGFVFGLYEWCYDRHRTDIFGQKNLEVRGAFRPVLSCAHIHFFIFWENHYKLVFTFSVVKIRSTKSEARNKFKCPKFKVQNTGLEN